MFGLQKRKYKHCSDEELLRIFKEKQISVCIGILYERYSHLVHGVCLKYLKNNSDAEDITSKIFELLGEKIIKHEISFFKSWLYMVTKNECFQLLRKKNIEFLSEDFQDLKLVDNNSKDFDLEELKLSHLELAMESLKTDQRNCIQLFYLNEKSYQEISDELNISLMNVKSHIQNGKRKLKILLEEQSIFKNETK